ncbi:MAG: tRNA (adenosine(37)-N6)-dimethylallyltransferase MiaA [bacterium]|nr:tRNA (adenosine(37)-N6)-dimethylallyltransferase MiaA [bacterium]
MVQKEIELLLGETASGKTDLLKERSKKEKFVVFNCDSRQIYKFLDIGTAKPDKDFLERVRHYFVDIVEYNQNFSAGDFLRKFKEYVESEDKKIILSVGTPFYLNSLIYGLDDIPDVSIETKKKVENILKDKGIFYLYELLKKVDPKRAEELNRNDKQRIVRSLEVYFETNKPISSFYKKKKSVDFKIKKVNYIFLDKDQLRLRISKRVERMVSRGLIEEVEKIMSIYGENIFYEKPVIGYFETLEYIKGLITKDKMKEKIVRNTLLLVKRQRTFFKKIVKDLNDVHFI